MLAELILSFVRTVKFLWQSLALDADSQFAGIDTTGDVRIPASYCGVIGFRPSHGAVSYMGIIPVSKSLDTVGMLCHLS